MLQREVLKRTFAMVIDRAQTAGVVRDDFTIDDVPMLMCGLSSTMAAGPPGEAFDWRRHLEFLLDAVRAR